MGRIPIFDESKLENAIESALNEVGEDWAEVDLKSGPATREEAWTYLVAAGFVEMMETIMFSTFDNPIAYVMMIYQTGKITNEERKKLLPDMVQKRMALPYILQRFRSISCAVGGVFSCFVARAGQARIRLRTSLHGSWLQPSRSIADPLLAQFQ